MGRQKWGAVVCLDCAAEAVGLCPTCTQARLDAAKAYQARTRKARIEYAREYRARMTEYQREAERRRHRKAENQ